MDLPASWVSTTLGEIGVEAQPGFASGKHNRDGVGVLHLRPMNITRNGTLDLADARFVDDISGRRVRSGDILFNNTNSPVLTGKTTLYRRLTPAAYSNHMTRLQAPGGIDPAFIAHQLHWMWQQGYFQSILQNHVNQASVSTKVLLGVPIVIPPLAEQQRIVATLEDHLSRLEVAERLVIDSGRRLVKFRSGVLEDSLKSAGSVKIVMLRDLLREPLRNGHSARASTDGTGVRTLTLTAVTQDNFSDLNTKMTVADPARVSSLWLEPDDILIQRSNTPDLVGTSAIYRGPKDWAIFPDLLIRVRTNESIIPDYAALVLGSRQVRRYLRESAKGLAGSMPKIDQSTIEGIRVPVPSLEDQKRIIAEVANRRDYIMHIERAASSAVTRSNHLRRSLLVAAFTGKLLPQDPADEPASDLLARIRTERNGQPKEKQTIRARVPRSATKIPTGIQEELPL